MKNIKPLYLIPPFIFFILAIIMFIGLGRDKPNELPSAMIGRYAPDLTITPLSSLPFLDKTHLKSPNIKIVNFWASWCAPCRVEHPNIQQLADLGFMVYGINYKDKAPQALQFLNSLGNPYERIGSDEGRTGLDWGLYGVPETFIIDSEGKVLLRHAGPITNKIMTNEILPVLTNQ